MRAETVRALRALDRRFYHRHAAGFAGSRQLPWPGWERALASARADRAVLRLLDAGCAHGRLAGFLAGATAAGTTTAGTKAAVIEYLGVDSSLPLLGRGSGHTTAGSAGVRLKARFVAADLLSELPLARDDPGFDLIALFGVLHHVPGQATRRDLLRRLAARLTAGGHLVLTAWRVERQPRFAHKRVAWQTYNRSAAEPIDEADLEPGDHLLVWGEDRETPRYCHAITDREADDLAAASGLTVADRFESDGPRGDRNLYLVLSPGAAAA